MPKHTCPFCALIVHMTIKWGEYDHSTGHGQFAASCDQCGRLSTGAYISTPSASRNDATTDLSSVLATVKAGTVRVWHPKHGVAPTIPDVPEVIENAAKEAHSNLAVGHTMSSLMMARAVIEACAKEKGIEKGRLVDKIDQLQHRGIIREHITEAAHELRHAGNDMAHGDFGDIPDPDDAAAFIEIMGEVLNEVFQSPARTARLKADRESRKAAKTQ